MARNKQTVLQCECNGCDKCGHVQSKTARPKFTSEMACGRDGVIENVSNGGCGVLCTVCANVAPIVTHTDRVTKYR